MAHQTFYRKYRQKQFQDLVGQDHIKAVLLGSLKLSRLNHAYLFCGPRGTGKTTIARILAKAINCLNPSDGEPCNICAHCQLIEADRAIDIVEIDAASNRGIDEIRDLRERVNFPPQILKKKVYIIDEVHMLTNEAFNALLKTLEEPPDHAIFILATTENHKVPQTVKSRTIRLNFHLGTNDQIETFLRQVARTENLQLKDQAFKLIATAADGGFRDAVSLLEQVSHHQGEITEAVVRQILALGEAQTCADLLTALTNGDGRQALDLLNQLEKQGASPIYLQRLLMDNLRQLLRQAISNGNPQKLPSLIALLNDLIDMTLTLRNSPLPFLPLELLIAKHSQKVETQTLAPNQVKVETLVVDAPIDLWQQVISELKNSNHSISQILKGAKIDSQNEKEIKISTRFKFHADRLMETKTRQLIEATIAQVFGKKLIFHCSVSSSSLPSSPSLPTSTSDSEPDLLTAAQEILG